MNDNERVLVAWYRGLTRIEQAAVNAWLKGECGKPEEILPSTRLKMYEIVPEKTDVIAR